MVSESSTTRRNPHWSGQATESAIPTRSVQGTDPSFGPRAAGGVSTQAFHITTSTTRLATPTVSVSTVAYNPIDPATGSPRAERNGAVAIHGAPRRAQSLSPIRG